MSIESKAFEAYKANRELNPKYHLPENMWIDWFVKGYERAEKDFKETKDDIRVHVNPNHYGNRKYYFTKDSKNCICVEYNPSSDYGEGSPSGAMIELVEIHTNNSFMFDDRHKEIDISEVPECIINLLTFLK